MADIVSAICAVAQCFQPASNNFTAKAEYISKFNENLECLKNSLKDLQAKRDDVLRQVAAEERRGWLRREEVGRWLSKVQDVETSPLVDDALALQQRCCPNICSTYRCGKKISRMLSEVKTLLSTGNFDVVPVVAAPDPPPFVVEEPVQQTFGLDEKLERTWKLLMDSGTRIMGLHGMGGVGKTTLLRLIEEKFAEVEDKFDVVIKVTVCKDADIGKIQGDIGRRLGLYDENWCQKTQWERANDIYMVLKDAKRRFVLLLDDLWEGVSLNTIGIPLQQGREYKVVFTTRSRYVCGYLEADQYIEVQCLGEKDAWDLFKLKSRCNRLSAEICDIAKKIAANCCGLPLALEVIGKSMASKTVVDEWRRALDALESSPSELKGTEEGIFQVLKLSYDNLKDNEKLCFQYCALFPIAHYIKQDELVEYWIGEGIIDEEQGRQRAKNRGLNIINALVEASLLLKDGEAKQRVYMHDMIRGMTLATVSESRDGERFVVETDVGLSKLPDVKDWTTVTKISLMNNKIKSIPDSSRLPNPGRLKTLFLQKNELVDIVGKFFMVISTLVVLDLSKNLFITELPEDISMLVALRYLNLLETGIKLLPSSFGALDKLIHLDLESTTDLQSISLISRLLNLQVLRLYRSASLDHSFLENLERLQDLKLLTITVKDDFKVLEEFLGSNMAGHTEGLYLDGLDVSRVSGKSFAATFGELSSLSKLGMTECNIIESETEWEDNRSNWHSPSSNTWFENLSVVVLIACIDLKDITWLIYATKLQSLSVRNSPKMEVVISKDKAGDAAAEPFLKLQVLELEFMNELKSIYWSPLPFPDLQKVLITVCPKLRKLPFSDEIINALHIKSDDEWWLEGVKWEKEAKEASDPVTSTASTASVSEIHSVT